MNKPYSCSECDLSFTRNYNLQRHKQLIHQKADEDEVENGRDIDSVTDTCGVERHSSLSSDSENEMDSASDTMEVVSLSSLNTEKGSETDSASDVSDDDQSFDDDQSSDDDQSDDDQSDDDDDGGELEAEGDDPFKNLIVNAMNQYQDKFEQLIEHYHENGLSTNDGNDEAFANDEAFEDLRSDYEKALKSLFADYITDMFAKRRNPLFHSILKKIKRYEDDGLDEDEAIKKAVAYRKHSIFKLLDAYSTDNILKQEDIDTNMDC